MMKLLGFSVGAILLSASMAQALSLDFYRITNNSAADASDQLTLTVEDSVDQTMALFTFGVNTGSNPGANIHEIYFDDGMPPLFAPPPSVIASTGQVSFSTGAANPGELPGAGNATPAFETSAGLLADTNTKKGGGHNGVTVGESLTLGLTYMSGITFADLQTALTSDTFRVGLHVGSLLGGESDAFVSDFVDNNSADVPLPAAGWMLLAGIGGLAVARRRKAA